MEITTTTVTTVTIDTEEIEEFISGSSAIVGYLPFIPETGMVKTISKLDYGSAILVPADKHAQIDETTEEALDDLPSIVSVGGYALDSLSNSQFSDIKRLFNSIVTTHPQDTLGTTGFLVRLVIQPTGIVATESISINILTGKILPASPNANFERFRAAHKVAISPARYRS